MIKYEVLLVAVVDRKLCMDAWASEMREGKDLTMHIIS